MCGGFRVSQPQWNIIERQLGLRPFAASAIPPKELVRARLDQDDQPKKLKYAYVNGGVTLMPAGFDFKSLWQKHQFEIAKCFRHHPMGSNSVIKSNMAALATAIGAYGKFDWLPNSYNYFHACFTLGFNRASDIHLVHMTGSGRWQDSSSLSQWVEAYWKMKMAAGIKTLKKVESVSILEQRSDVANEVLGKILKIIKMYDLDALIDAGK